MRNNIQREKRAEAKRFLSRFEGDSFRETPPMIITGHYTTGGYGDYIKLRDKMTADEMAARIASGKVLDNTKDQKNNTKFNWKNPSDSDLLRILIVLNVLLILINILRR